MEGKLEVKLLFKERDVNIKLTWMNIMCSMLSACICGLGYYTTLWGQLKEDETMKNKKGNVTTSDERVPLLQEQQEEGSQV